MVAVALEAASSGDLALGVMQLAELASMVWRGVGGQGDEGSAHALLRHLVQPGVLGDLLSRPPQAPSRFTGVAGSWNHAKHA